VTLSQDRSVFPCMPLGRVHVADAAVLMVEVVPMHESGAPLPGVVQSRKPFGRELRPVLNVEDTLQRMSVTLAAVSHDAWAADVCATP